MMDQMVETQIIRRGIRDLSVINAMRIVDRSHFVLESEKEYSFNDTPLPIGHGQTISQPYIVAYMTEQLKLDKNKRVLEIGTGSGYQTAILAEIVEQVYSIERIEELADQASICLNMEGYNNISIKNSDGYNGWKEYSPFDSIIVTAAATDIPSPLIEQLHDAGKMIIPIGPQYGLQYLILLEKSNQKIRKHKLIPVQFVPFLSNKN
ncbi:MAG: protein-L-isoaspartate(D-aspartate) O-methyltransferase [Spirochaetaceae bacterium]|jgi:protein-L-isoaspartate(D-aspartate) O-methyltransferase|nr:protein-L-isoaspartate(D-aspartate) O-methyltransferase [Spirochaetaceae bacterium]